MHFDLKNIMFGSDDVTWALSVASNFTAQKLKFSIKDFFSKCDQICQDLVTFTEEMLNEKFHFFAQ